MDQTQLELDFESLGQTGNEIKLKNKLPSAHVVSLSAVRKKKTDRETEDLYRAIIESVNHISPEPQKRYK